MMFVMHFNDLSSSKIDNRRPSKNLKKGPLTINYCSYIILSWLWQSFARNYVF